MCCTVTDAPLSLWVLGFSLRFYHSFENSNVFMVCELEHNHCFMQCWYWQFAQRWISHLVAYVVGTTEHLHRPPFLYLKSLHACTHFPCFKQAWDVCMNAKIWRGFLVSFLTAFSASAGCLAFCRVSRLLHAVIPECFSVRCSSNISRWSLVLHNVLLSWHGGGWSGVSGTFF